MRETKDTGRDDNYQPLLRQYAQRIQTNPVTTDAQRTEARLLVYDTTRTRAGVPQARPVLVVDTSRRLEHKVDFCDADTPNSRKKPKGVTGANIYLFIGGPPPPDPNQMQYVGYDTSTPYYKEFNNDDKGKNAWWPARYVNSRQEPGPWSETVMATIAG